MASVEVPDAPLYVIDGLDRGDDLRNASPAEALPVITARGHRPLIISGGTGRDGKERRASCATSSAEAS